MREMFKSFLLSAALILLVLSGCEKSDDKKVREEARKEVKASDNGDEKGVEKPKYKSVAIGTGGLTGVYYPTGVAISRIVNITSEKHKIKMKAIATKGSVANINAVMKDEAQFGLAQSDRQYQAARGEREWEHEGRQDDLRSVCSIHSESITLVTAENSGIHKVEDIRGKRINLGTPGSGHFGNARDVLKALGLKIGDLKPKYFKASLGSEKIQEKAIDAFFYTVGHPNAEIREASYGKIKIRIVPIGGKKIKALIKKNPYYTESIISKDHYPNIANKENLINSFGVKATLVTSSRVDPEIVYQVTKAIFQNANDLKEFHPALNYIRRGNMLKGLSARLHRGARKYYKEKGILEFIDPSIL